MSPVIEDDQANYYQTIVGQLIWAVEIGRIDINLEIDLLSRCLAQLRHDHIDHVFHNFSIIKSHTKTNLVLDPLKNDFDYEFIAYDW